jgi:hypothetical protein
MNELVAGCIAWIILIIITRLLRAGFLYFFYDQEIDYTEEQKTLLDFLYCFIGIFLLFSVVYYSMHYLGKHPNLN